MDPFKRIHRIQEFTIQRTHQWEDTIGRNMNEAENMDELENIFKAECASMKKDMMQQMNTIVKIVNSYCPEPWDPNYWQKQEYYKQLCHNAAMTISFMNTVFQNTFEQLKRLFRRLSYWIRDKIMQVYMEMKKYFRSAISKVKSWYS